MAQMSHHGGQCCGRRHIYGFDGRPTAASKSHIEQVLRNYNITSNANLCVEACLTDAQVERGWGKVLKKIGFKFVMRFRNSNSGNYVNVLLYVCKESPNKFGDTGGRAATPARTFFRIPKGQPNAGRFCSQRS